MKTKKLEELLKMYENAPKMKGAILKAIHEHGPMAEAIVVDGRPSHSPNSNCYKAAKARGWQDYEIYPGARRQFKTQGYFNVLVRTL